MQFTDHELVAAERAQQAELDRLDNEDHARRKAESAAIRAAMSSSPPPFTSDISAGRHRTSDTPPLASIHFNPAPEQSERILSAVSGPDFSLRDIAAQHNTTLEALTLWLARPDIQARTAALESACAQRTRLIVANYSVHVARILSGMLDAYEYFENHANFQPGSAYGYEQQRRGRESARKACGQLIRLANFRPESAPALPPGAPPDRTLAPDRVARAACPPVHAATQDAQLTEPATKPPAALPLSHLKSEILNSPPPPPPTPAQRLLARAGTLPTPTPSRTPLRLHSSTPLFRKSPSTLPLPPSPFPIVPLTLSAPMARPP